MQSLPPFLTIVLGGTVLTVIGIAFGGTFLLKVLGGKQGANDLQKTFFRAGHAHAGVLVTLGLTIGLLTHAAAVGDGWAAAGTITVLAAAIFMPAGFFLSVVGTNPSKPNRLITLLWLGAACLVVGLTISGVGILAAGIGRL
ncbi:hypothetical protein [Antrihabitans cavernicola]|uniref:DUF423 domain-containing protein n=1 Tax=Antrihabitans cavernicola TaxID=2495913 RepID=A0A5A7SCX2_9NOCA|nr:hypothetical protein [Spelaeibacter cavernicola]KAA0022345.1 hypothetical protein FOY51_15365 [Spelaeibacter cavernicola]